MTDTDWPRVRETLAKMMGWKPNRDSHNNLWWAIPEGPDKWTHMRAAYWRPEERWDHLGLVVDAMRAAGWTDTIGWHHQAEVGKGCHVLYCRPGNRDVFIHTGTGDVLVYADTEPQARCLAAYRALGGDDASEITP